MKMAVPGRGVPIAPPVPLTSARVPNWGCSTAQFFRVGLRSRYPVIIQNQIVTFELEIIFLNYSFSHVSFGMLSIFDATLIAVLYFIVILF